MPERALSYVKAPGKFVDRGGDRAIDSGGPTRLSRRTRRTRGNAGMRGYARDIGFRKGAKSDVARAPT